MNFLYEKHKRLSILLLPYSISTNLTPAISGCHRTPALWKVRKILKSKGSHSRKSFKPVSYQLSGYDHIPSWHCAAFVSAWQTVLLYVLNVVQILGNEGYKPPHILLIGQVVKPQSNFSLSHTSQGFAFLPSLPLLVSIGSFLFIPKLWKAFPSQKFFHLVLSCKGASLAQFGVCSYHTGQQWDTPVM